MAIDKLCMTLAVAIGLTLCSAFFTPLAYGEDIPTEYDASEFQAEVERTAAEYDAAVAGAEAAEAAVADSTKRIEELEALIPAQQERGKTAARELYKIQMQTPGLIELLLSAESFEELLGSIEYMDRVTQANNIELARLSSMKEELSGEYAELRKASDEANALAEEAKAALEAATAAREEAQRKAAEEAAARALEEQARRAAEEARKQSASNNDASKSGSSVAAGESAGSATADEGSSDNAEASSTAEAQGDSANSAGDATSGAGADAEEPVTSEVGPVNDGADWSTEESSFIASWGARIDAYLAGSPLAGQGATFAKAAWTYGVDPRWSPAISCVESGKGANCFNEHNAWGWGSASWDSWEEAINDHVKGLARGYGYTITVDAAKTYCPPNWKHWYEATSKEMNLI